MTESTKVHILPEHINTIIRSRRSIYPPAYNDKKIEPVIIEQILENANWAPNHRKTEPWRFKVFTGTALDKLSKFLHNDYTTHTPPEKFSEIKLKKTTNKPLQSACVIAICMQRDPEESLPEWEEIAAVACAVQNMWLTARAHNIGAYWSTPSVIHRIGDFLQLKADERCLGFFYMGYTNHEWPEGKRGNIGEKVVYVE